MGKKNKAKAQFNAQRELVSTLKAACNPLQTMPPATPIFSVAATGDGPYSDSNIEDYPLFLIAVQELQSTDNKPRALADLWNRAYLLGKRNGLGMDAIDIEDEIQTAHGDGWQEGYEDGSKVGEKYGYEKGMKAGITKMEEEFVGHVSVGECPAGRSLRVNAAVNTNNVLPLASTATQTENDDAASVTDYQSVADAPETFNWADDASSIPIYQPPHPLTSRNIEALRTEGVSKPFSSLQRRAHVQRKQRKPKSIAPGTTPPISQQRTTQPNRRSCSQSPASSILAFTVTYHVPPGDAKLDWDHDPRLVQLAFALRSLGWSPPS